MKKILANMLIFRCAHVQGMRGFFVLKNCLHSTRKQGKVFHKLMDASRHRKIVFDSDGPTLQSTPSTSILVRGKESSRRLAVLNKLFMEQITDLLTTGRNSEKLAGHGLQISKVKFASDLHEVNVFWFTSNKPDPDTEHLLESIAGGLRHELSQLRLIGQVPRINFVKDKTNDLMMDLQDALDKSDYGKGFSPKTTNALLKSETELEIRLPSEIREQIKSLNDHSTDFQGNQDSIPTMRNDTMGLDYASLMNRIKRLTNKSKLAWAQHASNNITN
ncbi:uncharacterized protein LOC129778328 [Toxorhynchites rutilus septentrionalis]|uniref:uncharacterized protein LOC129778328 n=1 Tax=Toxorhynchites rutilus septentrionalis TaxID=329112 RepID=UPI002478CD3A|nr:uncharacterized protein LOC129778328 [Toxorhynchites rutilus septentrionalis]